MKDNQILLSQTTKEEISELICNFSNQLQELKDSIPRPEQLLTREQTACLLDVDVSTLHLWNKKGKLKPRGLGNRVYYLRSEIMEALIPLNENK